MQSAIKKPIPVKFKLFEPGDEDGLVPTNDEFGEKNTPFIQTLEGKLLYGEYGKHYIVFGNHEDKWLVRKDIFEDTYEVINEPYTT